MHDEHKQPINVGVIIPTHNRVRTLPTALESVLRQTWQALDVLVVDDASTDGTAAYMESVTDPRVRYLRLDRQHGAGGARNEGLKHMAQEWVAFQDSDDTWSDNKIEKQLQVVARSGPELGVVYCRCRRTSTHFTRIFPPPVPVHSGHIFDVMLAGNLVSTQTALVRRDCFERYGNFNEALPPLEDWEFFLRISRHVELVLVDEVLVDAPLGEDSISHRDEMYVRSFNHVLDLYRNDYRARPELLARHVGTIADRVCMMGRWREGRSGYARAFRINPQHIGHAAGWLLSFCPPLYRKVRNRHRAKFMVKSG